MKIDKSTLVHLRLPFSFFLTPIFFMALIVIDDVNAGLALAVFAIIHFLLYPASNGFNSYYDKDEGSIGGIEHPPPVTRQLLMTVLLLDLAAVILGFLIEPLFAAGLLLYGMGSKAYSWDRIRLKRFPVTSLIMIGFGQGAATILMIVVALNGGSLSGLISARVLFMAGLGSLFLMASYPLTQVYQHDEDRKRGDTSFSMLLGIRGTFIFCGICFVFVIAGFVAYFAHYAGSFSSLLFIATQLPTAAFFSVWFYRVARDEKKADFRSTMWINFISAAGIDIFCVLFFVLAPG
jgi:1,4-dihydroxy-2-naphthoate octaprenyltransferase